MYSESYKDLFKEWVYDPKELYPIGSMLLLYEGMEVPNAGEWELLDCVNAEEPADYDGRHTMGVPQTAPIESRRVLCVYIRRS